MFNRYAGWCMVAEMYAAAAASTFVSIYYMFALLAGNGIAYLYLSKPKATKRTESVEVEMLMDSMLLNYSERKGAVGILSESINNEWSISGAVNAAIRSYKLSGDINRLKDTSMMPRGLGQIVRLVAKHAMHRGNMYGDMRELKGRMERSRRYEMKSYGMVHNGSIVVGLGTVVFFPILSGVGLNVLKFSGFGFGGAAANAVLLGVSAYLLLSNYLNFRYSLMPLYSKLMAGGMSGIAALSIFRITLLMSGMMLK